MAFAHRGRTIRKVGVVGSGQIGPDIALHFAKVLAPHGVPVVVHDIAEDALAAGRARAEKKIARGEQSGAFRPDHAASMREKLAFAADPDALSGADLVVEAATEDAAIKRKIFARLEELCPPEAILASNSSHMEPETIFAQARRPERGLVIHYFFPAERNPVVEVVPGAATDPRIATWLLGFYEAIGKVPIRVGSRYGYAVDPIFEGLFQAAALGVEAGWGTVAEVDQMVARALGLGVGPFTAMNLTGGNPITAHGLAEMHDKHHAWFRVPDRLRRQLDSGEPWPVAKRGEKVTYTEEAYARVEARMRGAYFGLAGQVLDSGITSVSDLEMAVEIALVVKPPFRMMNRLGTKRALELVEAYAKDHPDFPVPDCLRKRAQAGAPWTIPVVLRRDRDGVAVLVIRRPKVLNALNTDVVEQIASYVREAGDDPSIRAIVLTGFGTKAFVSGGDLGMLAALETAAEGEALCRRFHEALATVEDSKKPVVCALNGLALGGGNELAMACHVRLARKGLRRLAGQPEVHLGIIPGAGGTQRLPRWVGLERAAKLLRTGRPLSGEKAVSIGLVEEEVEGDLLEAAVARALACADGSRPARSIPREPLEGVPHRLPDVDLGHLSKATDAILCDAMLEGARKPLAEGLAHEARCFGRCVETEDMRIGMQTFREKGPGAEAPFVHR